MKINFVSRHVLKFCLVEVQLSSLDHWERGQFRLCLHTLFNIPAHKCFYSLDCLLN